LLALDEPAFRQMFAGGPVRRAGHARFLRNVLVAAGNSGEAALVPAIKALLAHGSPLVRGMAVWALRRLLDEDHYEEVRALNLKYELDADVVCEWD
jgi:epoxyqueuosine reductase